MIHHEVFVLVAHVCGVFAVGNKVHERLPDDIILITDANRQRDGRPFRFQDVVFSHDSINGVFISVDIVRDVL